MPEDTEGQVSEQEAIEPTETEQDEISAFNEDDKNDGLIDEFDDIDSSEEDEAEETLAADAKDDAIEETQSDDEEIDAGPTAKELAEGRGSLLQKSVPAQPVTPAPQEPKPTLQDLQAAASEEKPQLTKEQISKYLDVISIDDLPEGDVFIGNKTVNIREFAEAEPDQFNSVMVMAAMIAEKQSKSLSKNPVQNEELSSIKESLSTLQEDNAQLRLEIAVTGAHPGWEDIVKSDEFGNWLSTKPQEVQTLYNSMDPLDGISLLDYYKEEVVSKGTEGARSQVSEFDNKRKAAKATFDGIHKAAGRKGAPSKQKSALSPQQEELDGFNSKEDDDDF